MEDEGRIVNSASEMEEKGGKRRCVDRVENSVSVSVREAQVEDKQPCEDLDQSFVENPSSASASASASSSGTKGRVTGGYILKHLAVVASNFPRDCHEEDLVNSSLATTTVKRATKHPAFHSAPQIKEVAEDAFFKLPTPLAPVYAESETYYVQRLVEGKRVTEIRFRRYA